MTHILIFKRPAVLNKSVVLLRISQLVFFVIIVLGESFKVKISSISVSLSMVLIAGAFLCWFLTWDLKVKLSRINILKIVFAFLIFFFALIGFLKGNSLTDISEDAYPLVIFLAFSIVLSGIAVNQLKKLWESIFFFGILAAVKVFVLFLLPVDAEWDNIWQATKISIPGTEFYRIILRGGDLFLLITCLLLLIKVLSHQNKIKNFIFLFIVMIAVFISFSRSSFLAIAVSVTAVLFFFNKFFSRQKIIILFSVCCLIGLLLLPYLNIISTVSNLFEARVEAFDNNGFAMDFRAEEKSLIREKASDVFYTGNGLGSFFYLDNSGSDKSDAKSLYAHDFNYWMILKMGVLGLLCFYLIVIESEFKIYRFIKNRVSGNFREKYFAIALFGSLLLLLVVSMFANKVNTLSGAVFLAFFVTAVQKEVTVRRNDKDQQAAINNT